MVVQTPKLFKMYYLTMRRFQTGTHILYIDADSKYRRTNEPNYLISEIFEIHRLERG